MESSNQDYNEELEELAQLAPQCRVDMEAELSNKTQSYKPNNLRRTSDCLIDTSPGTSAYCNSYLNGKLKDRNSFRGTEDADVESLHSVESSVCRICHSNENPEKLISPCLCKGSLTYVHNDCLERWISMSRCTTCELCQFNYNTEQTLRYTFYQSLRLWYSRSMSRRALQEDCQMFLLLTLIAFGIVGTLLVAVQYYILQGHISGLGRLWTKGWLMFFLFTTVKLVVYLINVYMIIKSQLTPWYRWWQSARDIRLILENHMPEYASLQQNKNDKDANQPATVAEESIDQAAKMCPRQQNQGALRKSNELQQCRQESSQGIDAACQNFQNSLKDFCTTSNKCYNNKQLEMCSSSGVAATTITLSLNLPLEPAFESLILTV